MSEKDPQLYDLTRRKVLGGLTAVGLASAGAGLGTSAYFSDQETYEDNRLVAGSLDLKVDWEEHYSDWSDDEASVPGGGQIDWTMSDPSDDAYIPFPLGSTNPQVWVNSGDSIGPNDESSLDLFMNNTSIEAFPDDDDDGIQDDLSNYDACTDFADTPGVDMDPDRGFRSLTPDAVANWEEYQSGESDNAIRAPLVNLGDLKPGDFGELTLSFHLCDNPGYVWLNGELVDASENGLTEPEADDPDEEEGVVELLDEIQTMLWYDEDGDNVYEPSGDEAEEVDVVLVLDESGSMEGDRMTNMKAGANSLINSLNLGSDAGQVGVVSFQDDSNPVTLRQGLTTSASAATSAVNAIPNDSAGRTNMEAGIQAGQEELLGLTSGDSIIGGFSPSGNDRDGARKIMVFLGDGQPNEGTSTDGNVDPIEEAQTAIGDGIEIFSIAYGVSEGSSAAGTLESIASSDSNFFLSSTTEIEQVFGQISQEISGEECFFTGSLRTLLNELSSGNGIPLDGDRSTQFDEMNDDPASPTRDCFVDATTNNLGLSWWLPVNHANEIQSDSVTFDLGFYTEQCRHNDGGGMADEVIDEIVTTEGFGTNSGDTFSLTDSDGADYPEDMVTTIRGGRNITFRLDLPKPLDDSAGDNWSLTFDADDDGTADFQVTYNGGFGYQEFSGGSWGSASMPSSIQTSIEDSGGTYVVTIPASMLSSTFRFGGQLRYNGETPNNPGENFVINLVPGFAWGPGFNGDSSNYYTVSTS